MDIDSKSGSAEAEGLKERFRETAERSDCGENLASMIAAIDPSFLMETLDRLEEENRELELIVFAAEVEAAILRNAIEELKAKLKPKLKRERKPRSEKPKRRHGMNSEE